MKLLVLKTYTPDPEKAEIIRTIFKLMASGKYSIDTLREELFQRGMYFSATTRRWTRSHLAKLLRHPFYIGKIPWHGKIYEGKHKPIVNKPVWQKAQEILDGRGNTKCHKRRKFTYGHGLIKCAGCGYSITAETHKQQYTYYVCSQRRHLNHSVKPAWVPEQHIELQIVSLLDKLILPKEVYDWVIEYLKRTSTQEVADTNGGSLRVLIQKGGRRFNPPAP